jgi:hypothetical protein
MFPAIVMAQSKQEISFLESNNKNFHSKLTFDGADNKFVYTSTFNVALIENGSVSKSCKWSYKDMVKQTKFNAETNQFFALIGFTKVKELIYIDFNAAVPKPVKIGLSAAKMFDREGKGSLNIVCLDAENIRISCVGGGNFNIHDVNIKTQAITPVYEYAPAENNAPSIVLKYSDGNNYHLALLEKKSSTGNQHNFTLKHVSVNCEAKSMEVEREESIQLNCTEWNLQSYSDFFSQSGSSIVAIVYARPKGESTTLGMYVDVDNIPEGNKVFQFEIEDAYKRAATNDDFHMFIHEGKLHLFNNLEFYVDNRYEQASLHITVEENNEFELEKLVRGEYPYEYVVTKVLEQELPVSKTTHVSRNARINKDQITVFDIADVKKGKIILIYIYEFEQDK